MKRLQYTSFQSKYTSFYFKLTPTNSCTTYFYAS